MKARLLALWAALRERRDALLMGLAALLLAATFVKPGLPVTRAQIDAVAVVDITQSMNVPDGAAGGGGKPVSRLTAAKATLSRLVEQLPCGSRLGLGIFTEYRTLLLLTPIEVCEHQQELLGTLALIDGRMAWAGASEVAKAINSGMETVKALPDRPALLFLTDGHESPPVNPRYRPNLTVARGEVRGLIVGVGGDEPLAIPKFDPGGHPAGDWGVDEVLQIDPRSIGRGGSIGGEQMVEPEDLSVTPLPGVTPGSEHLSALREDYLRLLASETGLGYQRLADAAALREALEGPKLAREAPARLDLRPAFGAAALLCILIPLLPARQRRAAGPALQPAVPRAMRPQR
ncbi:MAG TPA: vWA domain-containing protein [Methylibium sp.]|nr:vWA domain-containing protein [Methylibium sp.]